ncbi:MAG: T9SS type A sorting domain-containing protein [bacterium]
MTKKKRYNWFLYTLFILAGLFMQNTMAVPRYVTMTGAGSKNGTNWDNAYEGLQAALTAAASGDQIWVAKGTYKPSSPYDLVIIGDRDFHFRMKDGVSIYGGFAGGEDELTDRNDYGVGGTNETILSGDIGTVGNNSDNCYHVFYHQSPLSLTSSAILDGFTIKDGNANGDGELNSGGGMFNSNSSPTITNCTFTFNYALIGGGISILNTCISTFTNCSFTSNTGAWDGGGIYNGSSPNFVNCTFSSNSSNNGGGIENWGGFPTFTNCLFSTNTAGVAGGGIVNSSSSPTYINCTIALNTTSGGKGGGIYNSGNPSHTTTLNNCIIWGNSANSDGDELYIEEGGSKITLNYSCYGNASGNVFVFAGGTFTATNNDITSDPQFVNTVGGDYRISGNSPCKNVGYNSYNSQLSDIRGQTRIQSTTIDLGAYEWTIGVDPDTPVPVELVSFTAFISNDGVILYWQTATEVNNYGFEVERSTNLQGLTNSKEGSNLGGFSTIGFVEGSGNSNSLKEYSFIDEDITARKYSYRLKQIDTDGSFTYSDIVEVTCDLHPSTFGLEQNFPNPFNSSTTIKFAVPTVETPYMASLQHVTLKIYDVLGREVATLLNKEQSAFGGSGYYSVEFNASGLPSGVYFYRLQTNDFSDVKKMIILK